MKFSKAIELMQQGHKVRRITWSPNSAWKMVDGVLYSNNNDRIDDWEVVEEKEAILDEIMALIEKYKRTK